jgi:hypothetical protein
MLGEHVMRTSAGSVTSQSLQNANISWTTLRFPVYIHTRIGTTYLYAILLFWAHVWTFVLYVLFFMI